MALPEYNVLSMAQVEMERGIKAAVTERIVQKYMDQIEAELRALVKAETDRITIGKIETFRDMRHIRDEVHVYVHHKEKDNHHEPACRN